MPNWLKTTLKIIAIIVVVVIVMILGVLLYINSNKSKVQAMVTDELNKSLDGHIIIGNMDPELFKDFPNISLSLHQVLLRDKRFNEHKHTLLNAHDFDVSVNTAALLRGTISINHIDISNAVIDLYTDSNGYSNTTVFKKSDKKKPSGDKSANSAAQISKFNLRNVSFSVNDQMQNKLFHFDINSLKGQLSYPDSGWHANVHLDITAQSMAFNTYNGSFIKGKHIEGELTGGYNEDKDQISVTSPRFDIGGNVFGLNAHFLMGDQASFKIGLKAEAITWRGASQLLAANIAQKLNMFNIDKPIGVKATIAGKFKGGGDPFLKVEARVRDNRLSTPGGNIDNCDFDAMYTNNFVEGKGYSDANSVIRIYHLKGSYGHVPFVIDTGSIINLAKPIATGNFSSNFPLADLNYLLGSKIAKFTKGTASMKLRYKADIVDYRLNKPIVAGVINLKDADIDYLPKNLKLTNTSLSMRFTQDALVMNNIRLQSGKSVVFMEGRVNNFLNLYYDSPEKILLTWQINSPQLYLGEFLGILNSRPAPAKKSRNSGNVIDQLSNVLDKSHAQMHMQVAKLYYKNFLATDAKADVLLSEDGVVLNSMSVKHAGGSLKMNGQIMDGPKINKFTVSAIVSDVNVHEFFYAFDNFGLTDITASNLQGFLSAKTQITGGLTDAGAIVPRSMNGMVTINLKNGALINYNPLKTVGKLAFPFRDLNNIKIPKLDARFDLHGDKIIINPLKLTSSVINADIAGTYGLNGGTNIALDIPLRNPKKDSTITDKDELLKKRYKGIVLHVLAKDDENGKIKIGWNKDHAKTP